MINKKIYETFKDESRCSKYAIIALFIIFIFSYTVTNKHNTEFHKINKKSSPVTSIHSPIYQKSSFTEKLLHIKIRDLISYENGAIGELRTYHILLATLLSILTYYLHRGIKNNAHKIMLNRSNIEEHKNNLIKISLTTQNIDNQTKIILSEEYAQSLEKTTSNIRFYSFLSCVSFGVLIATLIFGSLTTTVDAITSFILLISIILYTITTQNIFISSFMPLYVQIHILRGKDIDNIFKTLDD